MPTGSILKHYSPTPDVGGVWVLWQELVHQPILQLYHLQLSELLDSSIKTCVWVLPVFDVLTNCAAKTFHCECPVTPYWPSGLNPIGNVEKHVD